VSPVVKFGLLILMTELIEAKTA